MGADREKVEATIRRQKEARDLRPRAVRRGLFRFDVEIPSPDGGTAFRHTYAPYTAAERQMATWIRAGSVLRPPAIEMASAFMPSPSYYRPPDWVLDPLIGLGGERGVLVANLGLALLLAALSWWRLHRFRTPIRRRLFWLVAILTCGPYAFLCHLAIETSRAWRRVPVPAPAVPSPALLIASA